VSSVRISGKSCLSNSGDVGDYGTLPGTSN
jgi:hypothetical protein